MQDGETHVDGPFGGRGEDAPTVTTVRCPAHWEISQDRRLGSPHLGAMQDQARRSLRLLPTAVAIAAFAVAGDSAFGTVIVAAWLFFKADATAPQRRAGL